MNSPFWLQAGTAPHYHLSVALRASYHSVRLFLVRQPAIRRKLIDQVRQMLAQPGKQVFPSQAGLLAQRVERIAPERICQVLGRDFLILSGIDPGLRHSTMSTVLEFFDEFAEATAQHASSRGAAEQTAQSARN